MFFKDRTDAGRKLAEKLQEMKINNPYVLGLPRGGVPVAAEVAKYLNAPLDVVVVRKLGVPFHPEFAFGAISANDVQYVNERTVEKMNLSEREIKSVDEKERKELQRRIEKYRGDLKYPNINDKTAILVDDGIATGASFKAAIKFTKSLNPERIIIAVPVGAPSSIKELETLVDKLICLHTPDFFSAVGQWYKTFGQTTDEEVKNVLSNT
jgi:predicted phosphoribosyltransferase